MDLCSFLEDFTNNKQKSFFLLETPPGSGKTYASIEFILKNFNDKKIIFVTNQQILLPSIDQILEHCNNDESLMSLVKDNYLRVESIVDTFKKEFKKEDLPSDFLECNENIVCELANTIKALNDRKIIKEVEEYILKNFREKEYVFRKRVVEYCEEKSLNKNLKNYVTNQDWITKLYPQVLIKDKNIIVMTTKKFFYPIDPLYEGSYYLSEGIDKDTILIIDEFDSLKKELLNIVVGDTNNIINIDPFRLFKKIYNELLNMNLEEYKLNEDQELSEFLKNIQCDFKKFNKDYSAINKKFKTKDINENNIYLFNDRNVQLIANSNQTELFYNETKYFNEVSYDNRGSSLNKLIQELMYKINYFVSFVYFLASKYLNFYNNVMVTKSKKIMEKMNSNEAISTILDSMNLGSENYLFLMNKVKRHSGIKKEIGKKNKIDSNNRKYNFYKNGFSYIKLEDSYMHGQETKFKLYEYDTTPEEELLFCCDNYKVIAMSATANNKSPLINFDIDYLKYVLKNKFISINEYEISKIKQNYMERERQKYSDCPIVYNFDFWSSYKKEEAIRKLKRVIEYCTGSTELLSDHLEYIEGKEDYRIDNLCCLYMVFYEFLKLEDCHSFIYFDNITFTNKAFYETCKKTLNQIMLYCSTQCSFKFVTSDNIKTNKSDLDEAFSHRDKVFIITSYQSIGAGINLDYQITEHNCSQYFGKLKEKVNQRKDIDGIFLSKPTNVFPSSLSGNFDDDNLAVSLYALEYINICGDLKDYEFNNCLKNCLNSFSNKTRTTFIKGKYQSKNSIVYGMLRFVEQSIGRLTRSDNKNTSYIWMDRECLEVIVRGKDYLKNKWNNYLIEDMLTQKEITSSNYKDYKLINNEKEYKIFQKIRQILNRSKKMWTAEDVAFWNDLREYVMKYPTIDNADHKYKDYYFIFDTKENSYSYSQFKNYCFQKIYGVSNDIDYYPKTVSQEQAKLDRMIKIPGLKEYFELNGYATNFEKRESILSPTLFESIYQGALGEVVGKYILNKNSIDLVSLDNDLDKFEKFDYKISDGIYLDLKNWFYYEKDKEKTIKNILKKAKMIGAKKVYICNILHEGYDMSNTYKKNEVEIVTVPWLYDDKKQIYNYEIISKIKEDSYE